MKKGKLVFCIIAFFILALCIAGSFFVMRSSEPAENSPEATLPIVQTAPSELLPTLVVETDPPVTAPPFEYLAPVKLAPNVTLQQVSLIGEIDRKYVIREDHPEYIDVPGGDPYWCTSGIVFRNDRTITIDIQDTQRDVIHSISFGHITGQCNRFLYLNPICADDGQVPENTAYHYQFEQPVGGGAIYNLGDNSRAYDAHTSFFIGRTLEEWENASYTSPKMPGTVWHIGGDADGPFYIDCRVYQLKGDMIATLRLTISRMNDGTFAITNLEDKNQLNPYGGTVFSASELEYLVSFTDDTYHDPDQVHFTSTSMSEEHIEMDECIIEYIGIGEPLYYNQFLPHQGSDRTQTYVNMEMPIVAVSYRKGTLFTQTFYFQQILPEINGVHGVYAYIGRDYPMYDTIERLRNYGYTDNG